MEYSSQVRERFEHPSNVGRLSVAADVISASAGSIEQGVKFWLYARVARGRIEELKYRVYGCPHSIAAVSLASEQLVHLDLENLGRWHWRQVAEKLDVPAEKRGRLLTLEDAVRGLATAWRAHP